MFISLFKCGKNCFFYKNYKEILKKSKEAFFIIQNFNTLTYTMSQTIKNTFKSYCFFTSH